MADQGGFWDWLLSSRWGVPILAIGAWAIVIGFVLAVVLSAQRVGH